MKEKTYKLIPCNSFDARELQQWISEEAAAGYFFQSGTTTWIQFRKDTPKAGVTYILQPDTQKRRLYDESLRYLGTIHGRYHVYLQLTKEAPRFYTATTYKVLLASFVLAFVYVVGLCFHILRRGNPPWPRIEWMMQWRFLFWVAMLLLFLCGVIGWTRSFYYSYRQSKPRTPRGRAWNRRFHWAGNGIAFVLFLLVILFAALEQNPTQWTSTSGGEPSAALSSPFLESDEKVVFWETGFVWSGSYSVTREENSDYNYAYTTAYTFSNRAIANWFCRNFQKEMGGMQDISQLFGKGNAAATETALWTGGTGICILVQNGRQVVYTNYQGEFSMEELIVKVREFVDAI